MWLMRTFIPVSGIEGVQKEKDKALLGPTELPARSVDLSALNLTELVNRMLSRALKESRRFFSLLSISSYSSFAFHKVSVAVYNISNLKTVDPAKFPTRFCYCLNNRTNDVSDFTALLVDIVENSTGSLTEVFRSTSLLSVSHTDESDCIFICVMAGKAGRNLSDFWEMAEKSPVINYTFMSSVSGVLATRRVTGTPRVTTDRQTWASKLSTPRAQAMEEKTPGGPPWETPSSTSTSAEAQQAKSTQRFLEPAGIMARPSSPAQSSPASGMVTTSTQTLNPTKAPAPKDLQTGEAPAEWPPTPGKQPAPVPAPLQASRCPHPLLKEGTMTAAPVTLAMQKLNPCLMELCRFLQRCLCGSQRKNPTTEMMRYCLEYYSWFLKNATSLCQKVKRVSNSHSKCPSWLCCNCCDASLTGEGGSVTLRGCPALAGIPGVP
ncbi:HERV-H LTR-associating protein 1 [Fukomys damarensis]|uniref:HERV-H LTR-associating protein 1 n=1 Tax=Fukomys damarensis TaxID=885580 RepID=A0A091DKE6_FUKDA|nr:HERV-H LTR-associating protein 1 [Fukomys damarensis]